MCSNDSNGDTVSVTVSANLDDRLFVSGLTNILLNDGSFHFHRGHSLD